MSKLALLCSLLSWFQILWDVTEHNQSVSVLLHWNATITWDHDRTYGTRVFRQPHPEL